MLVTHSPLLQLTPHHAPLIHCVLPGLFSVHQRSLPPQDLCTSCFLCQGHFPSSCGSLLPTIHDSAHSHLFGKDFIDLPHLLPGSVCFFLRPFTFFKYLIVCSLVNFQFPPLNGMLCEGRNLISFTTTHLNRK